MFRAVLFAVMATFLAAGAATAQSSLLQAGPTTPGHAPQYVGQSSSQPIVQDSGGSGGGGLGANLGEIGITARSPTGTYPSASSGNGPHGEHGCFYDGPTNNPTGYHYFCLDPNAAGGGLLAYGSGGVATPLPFNFMVNGTSYTFPFTVGGIVGPGTTVVGDIAAWNSTTGSLLKDIPVGSGVLAAIAQPVTGSGGLVLSNSPTLTGTVTLPAGTAAANLGAPLGTSGATIPLNNGNNTTSGNNIHNGTETFTSTVTLPAGTAAANLGFTPSNPANYAYAANSTNPFRFDISKNCTVDPTGATDMGACINSTIADAVASIPVVSNAPSSPGSTAEVYIPCGTYKVSTQVTLKSFVIILGGGRGCTVFKPTINNAFVTDQNHQLVFVLDRLHQVVEWLKYVLCATELVPRLRNKRVHDRSRLAD